MRNREEDLVALVFCSNNCYTKVVDIDDTIITEDKYFSLDYEKGIWNYGNLFNCWENIPIGKARTDIHTYKNGVIGVYDRTNTNHLSSMVRSSQEVTDRNHLSLVDDD